MSETYSDDLAVDSGDEGVVKMQTVGFRQAAHNDMDEGELEDYLDGMDKNELIRLITSIGK